uniref:Uncharacterized protein n=1 Tax=Cacopsylla melanoneura TaxID=428564 RepID=A0A8D8WMT9_9HEMI
MFFPWQQLWTHSCSFFCLPILSSFPSPPCTLVCLLRPFFLSSVHPYLCLFLPLNSLKNLDFCLFAQTQHILLHVLLAWPSFHSSLLLPSLLFSSLPPFLPPVFLVVPVFSLSLHSVVPNC